MTRKKFFYFSFFPFCILYGPPNVSNLWCTLYLTCCLCQINGKRFFLNTPVIIILFLDYLKYFHVSFGDICYPVRLVTSAVAPGESVDSNVATSGDRKGMNVKTVEKCWVGVGGMMAGNA